MADAFIQAVEKVPFLRTRQRCRLIEPTFLGQQIIDARFFLSNRDN